VGAQATASAPINGVGSSAAGNGNTLTLTLNITFSGSFSGNKVMYLAQGRGGKQLGMAGHGRLASSRRSPGHDDGCRWNESRARRGELTDIYLYLLRYEGLAGSRCGHILLNDFLDGRHACYLAYARSINVLYLVNDAGDGLLRDS